MITCMIIIAGLSYAIQLSNVSTVSRTSDVETIAQNILNVIDDPNIMSKVVDNSTQWKPELASLIANLLPPDTFYNLTIRSALENGTVIGQSNNLAALNASSLDQVTEDRVVTVSLPITRTTYSPLDIVLIMDNSGSMADRLPGDTHTKLYYAQQAAISFVNQLNASRDRVGLSCYRESAILPVTSMTNNFAAIKTAINAMYANGWTDMGDGIANYPQPDPHDIYTYAHNYALSKAYTASALPVRFYTIGLGPKTGSVDVRIDEPLLQSIAASSQGGRYYYAPSAQDLSNIYNSIVEDLMFSIRYDVITLELTIIRP